MSSRSGSILLPHSLRAKLTLPLLVLLAVVAGAIGFSVYEQRGMSAANEALARQTMPALTQSADVLGSLYRAHLHERAALNVNVRTDDFKQVRTAHDTELQEAAKGIESLRRLAGGADEGSATLVQTLHEAYLAWSTTSLEVFDNLAKDSRFARLLAIDLSGGKSREQFDALEEKITRLKDDWVARSEANVEAMGERSALAQKLLTVIGVLAAVFAAAVAILLPSTLSRRLNDIRSRIVAISEGDGDLTQRLKIGGDDEIARIAQAFDRFVENLHETIRRATIASQAVAASTQEIASGNQNLASRAEEQAAHLVNASHSLSQMAESIAANAASAEQVSQTTRGTRDTADRGNEVIRRAIRAMQEINEASQRIGDIIGVVDSIAFQTNILALNAAVEAARAGEQGRGFSVVASEVRSLAQRSASSANEIKTLINAATEKVQLGSELVNASGETLEEIMAAIREVTATVTEIAESTTAQSHEVQGINHMIQEIGDGMQATTAFVEEVAASSAQLNERADELLQEVGRFRLEA